MDTGTHVVMGLALGGLATLDPVVAESQATTISVMIATLAGSQAPDIDTVLKLRNNAVYIRNHRGITHSIPAVILWPLVIIAVIYPFFPVANLLHLWLWTFLAVFLHVFVDIFNAYGTQALRPFSSKWIALGFINTFDPIIFTVHVIGLFLWAFGSDPGYTFSTIYILLVCYYFLRYFAQRKVKNKVKELVPNAASIILSPTMRYNHWRVAVMTDEFFYVGKAHNYQIKIYDKYERVPIPITPALTAAQKDKNLSAFLSFSPVYRWEVQETDNQFQVRFIDLRYRSNGHYPFVAVVHLDQHYDIISSYTGWIFSEEKLRKKLDILTN
ncbi:metal-dependent hydrolase [Niallia sp. 01092]|uniref:metal-dependent hydrolase n=1 Tax=unclassified Niallia TaxID=2837522 RepID=UPI003FD1D631